MVSTGGRFYRKIGFGLRPDEDVPRDRLGWAVEQISGIPSLIWPGKIYSVDEMLDKLMKSCSMSRKKCQILTKKIEDVFEANTKAQLEVQSKREKMMTNRRNISELRKVIDVFI